MLPRLPPFRSGSIPRSLLDSESDARPDFALIGGVLRAIGDGPLDERLFGITSDTVTVTMHIGNNPIAVDRDTTDSILFSNEPDEPVRHAPVVRWLCAAGVVRGLRSRRSRGRRGAVRAP